MDPSWKGVGKKLIFLFILQYIFNFSFKYIFLFIRRYEISWILKFQEMKFFVIFMENLIIFVISFKNLNFMSGFEDT